MTLSNNPTKKELVEYKNWTHEAASLADEQGMYQKACYFRKREEWAINVLNSMKIVTMDLV